MSLSFPLAMPTDGIAAQDFRLARVDYASPEVGGAIGAVAAGFPRWRMTLQLGDMSQAAGDAWRAFLDSLDGAGRTFFAHDLLRPYPAAYPGGFGGMTRAAGGSFPADGEVGAWSLAGDRDELVMSGLPANFVLTVGDLIGFRWGTNKRTIVRVQQTHTGDGAGWLQVPIRPALPTLVPAEAEVYFERPALVMRISAGDSSVGAEDQISTTGGTIVAGQDLRP